jgi:CheY-like chemotaxis protein
LTADLSGAIVQLAQTGIAAANHKNQQAGRRTTAGDTMNPSLALIVDDSKTSHHLLKRMLQKFHLRIDSVMSAEEALAYLSYNHPAVIFLDQQMTGMTGMEALKTIRANPHTALIPVIMYTSQNDDLFISQAIALGAQGVFNKSAMEHASLERVLQGLSIPLAADAEAEDAHTSALANPAQAAPIPTVPTAAALQVSQDKPSADLDLVRSQIGRLFEIHIADVRNQINSSTQFIIKRLSANFEQRQMPEPKVVEKKSDREAVIADRSLAAIKSVVQNAIGAERERIALISNGMLIAVVLAVIFFGYALWQIHGELEQTTRNYQAITEAREKEAVKVKDSNAAANTALLKAIGWMQNADFQFNYGEPAFGDMQLANLNKLVHLLADGGYKGPLLVDIHFGNVCLEPGEKNIWRLARPDLPATSCKLLNQLYPNFQAGDLATPAFQKFEKSALPIQDGRIRIQLHSSGMLVPRADYPTIRTTTTAGEWNRAALKNNRISIQFPNLPAQ